MRDNANCYTYVYRIVIMMNKYTSLYVSKERNYQGYLVKYIYIVPFTGWEGPDCTTDTDECTRNNPCQNGATCNNTLGSYNCFCAAGYSDKNCSTDIDDCEPKPCKHGSCIDRVNRFECNCTDTGIWPTQCTDSDRKKAVEIFHVIIYVSPSFKGKERGGLHVRNVENFMWCHNFQNKDYREFGTFLGIYLKKREFIWDLKHYLR